MVYSDKGNDNTALGDGALYSNRIGDNNSAVGLGALNRNENDGSRGFASDS